MFFVTSRLFSCKFPVRYSISSISKQRMAHMCPLSGSSGILCFVPLCLLEADTDAVAWGHHSCLKTWMLQFLLLQIVQILYFIKRQMVITVLYVCNQGSIPAFFFFFLGSVHILMYVSCRIMML